ncbi:phenylalanine 4-monooxygenase [Vibrio sp. SCSIO 43132]|uniref:phenylalanine 4-monooxygenase n=1 Tax=Vibrio sp. SCSIO 43132 TaxID=2779363 RepID=UPI001CA92FEA|nr:phenylalanine 4-monooxygenase [Vibrio sp. SCSIO 43132]UAB72469.1 phenylalanine 4-monooxygenase [Vibrio sp. SCSIO 43132]
MTKQSQYRSKSADENGIIQWTDEENSVWHQLVERQLGCIQNKACDEYMDGLDKLNLPSDRLPQLEEINAVLKPATGWQCEAVPALISFDRFFELLANKHFPVATFIRTKEDMEYLQEPDIFHEIFGHCAMLTHPAFAAFTEKYGKLGLNASKEDRVFLARLYWFTVEFGLIKNQNGLSIYGGGILSSPGETQYVYSGKPMIAPLDPIEVLRTPYRIDIMQPKYFYLDGIEQLFELADLDIMSLVKRAKSLGLHKPMYELES